MQGEQPIELKRCRRYPDVCLTLLVFFLIRLDQRLTFLFWEGIISGFWTEFVFGAIEFSYEL